MNVAALLQAQALARPRDPAIVDTWRRRDRTTTFADLEDAAARGAALLWQAGLRPGDAVLVVHPVSAELYIALLAIFRLGLVAMLLDPASGLDHIERCCALHPPRGFIGSPAAHLLRLGSPALRRIPQTFVIGAPLPWAAPWARAGRCVPRDQIHPCAAETPALLTFTSGSTGQPRAVLRTHGLLRAQHRVLERNLGYVAGEVSLTALPVFVLADLASGVTSLLPRADLRHPGSIDPAPVIAQLQTHGAVRAGASPALWDRVARYCLRHGLTLPHVRKLYTGGAPVFPPLLEALQRIAPCAEIVAVYGSTEAEPIAHIAWHDLRDTDVAAMVGGRGLLAGTPVGEISVRILPDRWGAPLGPYSTAGFDAGCCPAGQPGEIVVSGPHVLPGYLHGDGDAETTIHVEGRVWRRTGDAGYLDADGRLWLLGRCAARIDDACGVLYPFAIECAASVHRPVRRSAVVAHAGRRVLAVELDEPAAQSDLVALETALAWARLDAIQVLRRIPVDKRHNAKVDYPALYSLLDQEM